jgi:hypothetical protein
MGRRRLIVRLLPGLVLLVAGMIVAVLAGDTAAGGAAGMTAMGLGGIYLVSMAFYEIGLSEDRARDRDQGTKPRARGGPGR